MKARLVRKSPENKVVQTVKLKKVKPIIEYRKPRPKKTIRGTMYA